MPRVSRSVSQRYANASKKKAKRRGEGSPAVLPPRLDQPPVELPAGLAAPEPLDLPAEPPRPHRAARAAERAERAEARGLTRGEIRHATRRLTMAPIVDYSYVTADLRRIGVVTAVLLAVLAGLWIVPGLH